MLEHPTPGQVNFETYWRTLDGIPPLLTWEQRMPDDRAAWEAAAEAVRAREEERAPTPGTMHFGHTMHAAQGLCGAGSPWVSILPRLVTCQACIALMRPSERKEVPHG